MSWIVFRKQKGCPLAGSLEVADEAVPSLYQKVFELIWSRYGQVVQEEKTRVSVKYIETSHSYLSEWSLMLEKRLCCLCVVLSHRDTLYHRPESCVSKIPCATAVLAQQVSAASSASFSTRPNFVRPCSLVCSTMTLGFWCSTRQRPHMHHAIEPWMAQAARIHGSSVWPSIFLRQIMGLLWRMFHF